MPALVVKPYLEGRDRLIGWAWLHYRHLRGDTNGLFKGKATSSKMSMHEVEEGLGKRAFHTSAGGMEFSYAGYKTVK